MTAPEPKIDVDALLAWLEERHPHDGWSDNYASAARYIRFLCAEHEALRADFEMFANRHTDACIAERLIPSDPCVCGLSAARARWAKPKEKK